MLVHRLFKDSGSHHARRKLVLLCSELLDPLVLLHPRAVVSLPIFSLTNVQAYNLFPSTLIPRGVLSVAFFGGLLSKLAYG